MWSDSAASSSTPSKFPRTAITPLAMGRRRSTTVRNLPSGGRMICAYMRQICLVLFRSTSRGFQEQESRNLTHVWFGAIRLLELLSIRGAHNLNTNVLRDANSMVCHAHESHHLEAEACVSILLRQSFSIRSQSRRHSGISLLACLHLLTS